MAFKWRSKAAAAASSRVEPGRGGRNASIRAWGKVARSRRCAPAPLRAGGDSPAAIINDPNVCRRSWNSKRPKSARRAGFTFAAARLTALAKMSARKLSEFQTLSDRGGAGRRLGRLASKWSSL